MKPEFWQEESATFYAHEQWVGLSRKQCPARYLPVFRFLVPYLLLPCWSPAERSVLEIGCAAGHTFGFLENVFPPGWPWRYEGLDISPHHVEKARELYPHIPFHLKEGLDTGLDDRCFNTVLTVDVLMHNWDVEGLLREWFRITGHCLIVATRTIDTRPTIRAFQGPRQVPYHILNTEELTSTFARLHPDCVVGVPFTELQTRWLGTDVHGLPSGLMPQEVGHHTFFVLRGLPPEATEFLKRNVPAAARYKSLAHLFSNPLWHSSIFCVANP